METMGFFDIFLCEHKDNWVRYPILYMGPIDKILGPWYHYFEDQYICNECRKLQKNNS